MNKKNISDIDYRVKMMSDFTEPYMYESDLTNITTHRTIDEYVVHNEKTFYDVLNEFLDAPKKKLTDKDIRKDFDSENRKLPDSKVQAIKAYYNGRYDLKNKMFAQLKKVDLSKVKPNFPVVMKFNIPFSMNFFSCEENDQYDNSVKMNDAYIEIEVSRRDLDI